jgi:hypothetical protein
MHSNRRLDIRLEVTIYMEKVVDGRQLCNGFDLLRLRGMESALGGPYYSKGASIDNFLRDFRSKLQALVQEV